jgi:hypothetical protein
MVSRMSGPAALNLGVSDPRLAKKNDRGATIGQRRVQGIAG